MMLTEHGTMRSSSHTRQAGRPHVAALLAVLLLTLIPGKVIAVSAQEHPFKLVLESDKQTFEANTPGLFILRLLSQAGTSAAAPIDLLIPVKTVTPAGRKLMQKVTISKGEADSELRVDLNEQGIYETRTESRQLLNSGLIYRVESPNAKGPSDRRRIITDSIDLDRQLSSSSSGRRASLNVAPAGDHHRPMAVALRAYPEEPRMADGKDSATIFAYLLGDNAVALENIQIVLHNRKGQLDPNVLLIKKGNFRGRTTLRSQNAGRITVEYMNADPPLQINGASTVEVEFRPPVTAIEFTASPDRITMFGDTRLIVKMLDPKGGLITDEHERMIYLSIKEGRGRLETQGIVIAQGQAQTSTGFTPTATGKVLVQASTPGLLVADPVEITVTWPILILCLTIAGALGGGTLSWILKEKKNKWLIPAGLVSGLILYWAVLYGLIDLMPRHLILNPYSALAIAVIGGWMGPKALDLILNRFGVSSS